MCEDEYAPVERSLTKTLEVLRDIGFEKFCEAQCESNICEIESEIIPKLPEPSITTTEAVQTTTSRKSYGYAGRFKKRQLNACSPINVNNANISNSNFISSKKLYILK